MGYEDIEVRMGKIESELGEAREDIASIKTYVTNHIPHALGELNQSMATLKERIKPLETRATKASGISEFLSVVLKAVGILTASVWIVLQIFNTFVH